MTNDKLPASNRFERHPFMTMAVFTLVVLFLLAATSEVGMRLYGWHPDLPVNYFQIKPNAPALGAVPNLNTKIVRSEFEHEVSLNDFGIRDDRKMADILAPGLKRIMIMGDSFGFGFGVEYKQMFSTRLQNLLKEQGRKVSVFSTATENGHYPVGYEFYLSRELNVLRPDVVVIGIFVGNDLIEGDADEIIRDSGGSVASLLPKSYDVVDGMLVPKGHATAEQALGTVAAVKKWLARNSAIYAGIGNYRASMSAERKGASENQNAIPWFYVENGPTPSRTGYREMLKSIDKIVEILEREKRKLVFLLIPVNFQIGEHYREVQHRHFNMSRTEMDKAAEVLQPQAFLSEYLKQRGVKYIDLVDEIRRQDKLGNRLYYDLDGHWNAAGHASTAQILYRFLEQEQWTR